MTRRGRRRGRAGRREVGGGRRRFFGCRALVGRLAGGAVEGKG